MTKEFAFPGKVSGTEPEGASLCLVLADGREIAVQVIVSQRRTLAIHVSAGKVKVRAPQRCSMAAVRDFLAQRKDWIERTLAQLPVASQVRDQPCWVAGSRLPFMGEELVLDILPAVRRQVTRQAGKLAVHLSSADVDAAGERVAAVIELWYRQQANRYLPPRTMEIATKLGVRPRSVRIGKARGSWGRCVQGGHIHFTWHLIKAPKPMIDSVIIHELCHLHELNHSPRFWALVAMHDPHHQAAKKWFRENEARLMQ